MINSLNETDDVIYGSVCYL